MMRFVEGKADISAMNNILQNVGLSLSGSSQTVRMSPPQIYDMIDQLQCLPEEYVNQCFQTTQTDAVSGDMFVRMPSRQYHGVSWLLIFKLRSGNAQSKVGSIISKGDEVVKCDTIGLSADYALGCSGTLQQLHCASKYQYNIPTVYSAMRDKMTAAKITEDSVLSFEERDFFVELEKTFFQVWIR